MILNLLNYFKNKAIILFNGIKLPILLYFAINTTACKVQQPSSSTDNFISLIENSAVFNRHFMGFSLFDPEKGETLYNVNSDKYFTPASNTKLFTFYTCLRILGDSVPSLRYTIRGDSLLFTGTGDPSFLHPEFTSNKTYAFLKNRSEKLYYIDLPFHDEPYGPGWSWDDYQYTFSAEKAPFPIYGNYVNFIYKPMEFYPNVSPAYFNRFVSIDELEMIQGRSVQRKFSENIFSFQIRSDTVGDTVKIPFKFSPDLLIQLLSDTLKNEVTHMYDRDIQLDNVFYGFATDSLYKELLTESDNFIAEQLMLLCAYTISDTFKVKNAIDYAKEHFLIDLEDKIKWVDGSGLSRYNLLSPRSMIYILEKIYKLVPETKLFHMFPEGGTSGTLKKWYKADIPYVFAKTGTLSNVHCLSGYVKTKSGKVMIFSFMHNNYINSADLVRHEMEKVLRQIYLDF